MADVPVTIACGNYDRTRAIKDGTVRIEGCAVTYLPLYPEEIFHRVFKFSEFDISELSFSSYIRTVAAGNASYIGIPVFVSRIFRHSGIYVRTGSRKIYAVSASACPNIRSPRWCGCAVASCRASLLSEDRVISDHAPDRHPQNAAEKYPWLATSVYKAFCEAKALAVADLRDVNALTVSLPWLEAETNETSALMGRDFWKYGVAENEPEIEALTEYLHEQGLVDRKLAAVELFHPSTFELAKV
jgi:hypothetical protein